MWRPISGYEDYYSISSEGAVWSNRSGKPLRPVPVTRGYLTVHLSVDGARRTRLVHHLVLEAFVGPCPPGLLGRHLNDINTDNRVENLAWGTHAENSLDCSRNGHNVNAVKTHCSRGHEYNEENTYICKNGARSCRACNRERDAVRRSIRRS